ncbi:MAG: hypothetical protein GY869_30980 [Planctomycetes bacterium]|nr:hypothetical protein [Planctomycetota bacterium]
MRYFYLIFAALLLTISVASADTIYLEVQTDQDTYALGQTVNWTIYAWTGPPGNNRGISLITFNLDDSANEALSPALTNGSDFADTEFGTPKKFTITRAGTPSPTQPRLLSILTLQSAADRMLDIGNDGNPHVLCKGSYTATVLGSHTLRIRIQDSETNAQYWTDASGGSVGFEDDDITNATFEVTAEPIVCGDPGTVYLLADLDRNCFVDIFDYNVLGTNWGRTDCVGTSWCQRADIDMSGEVNMVDLQLFCSQWLYCTDPANSICDAYWK